MWRSVVLIALLLFLISLYPALLLVRSTHSEVSLDPVPKAIGRSTPLIARVSNPHGFRSLVVWVEQNGAREKVFETTRPAVRWAWKSPQAAPEQIGFRAGGPKEGKARLVIEVESNDLLGSVDTASYDVTVILKPPSLTSQNSELFYVNQGGTELAMFKPDGEWSEAGVRAGPYTARSFPKPGSTTGDRFSLFPFPWDLPADTVPRMFVRNVAGDEVTAPVPTHVTEKKFRRRDIEITDAFIDKVLAEIDPSGTGDKVERFLKINREMRQANNKTLADLRFKTAEKFLWTGAFMQLGHSKVESFFADVRSYIYHGKKIDEQVHLGFDLSAVKQTPVSASNDGVVVYADRLGIYGNCIVVDHGYGLQSIYGHLSSIGVKVGDAVKKGQEMGRSGATGMAGGDHLHFSMQVEGTQINPTEWWDEHWIRTHVLEKLVK